MYWFTNDIHVYCYVQMYNILYHESAMLVKWYHMWNTLVRACGLLAVNKTLESWKSCMPRSASLDMCCHMYALCNTLFWLKKTLNLEFKIRVLNRKLHWFDYWDLFQYKKCRLTSREIPARLVSFEIVIFLQNVHVYIKTSYWLCQLCLCSF